MRKCNLLSSFFKKRKKNVGNWILDVLGVPGRLKGIGLFSPFPDDVFFPNKGRLPKLSDYICPTYDGKVHPIDHRPTTQVILDGSTMDIEPCLFFLGDMLCPGGGCELTIIARFSVAWGKFRKLLPILTSKYVSLRICV